MLHSLVYIVLFVSAVWSAPFAQPERRTTSVTTPLGTATGTTTITGVTRYAVRYATASRWATPSAVTTWQLPNNDAAALPPWCPQPDAGSNPYSEDCLFVVLYVPDGTSSANTLLWIHGGSFYTGAATYSGLDGSQLAIATASIVVTVQYRLGVLGFLPPSPLNGNINLGAKDVAEALSFLHTILPSFGGDVSQITVAGQSSGATMIRALLAAPTAASLFKNAILQSDDMYLSFLPLTAYTSLQSSFYSSVSGGCSGTDTTCLAALPLASIMSAQADLISNAASISPAAGSYEPMRPTVDGSFITTSLSGSSYPSSLKPIILTTVKNEAGYTIGTNIDSPGYPDYLFPYIVSDTFGEDRTDTIMNSGLYDPSSFSADDQDDDLRQALELLGTDASWRCSGWSFARAYAAGGGSVYTGVFMAGATYAGSESVSYCTTPGRVCHQDDIYITFGTTPSPTTAQSALTTQIQSRWSAFMHTSNPNPSSSSYESWSAASSTDAHALNLGAGGGSAAVGACTSTFWGNSVEYDWQIYGV